MPELILKPLTLKELWRLPPSSGGPVKYLAGGTDLMTGLNAGVDTAPVWVDISGLRELQGIKETKNSVIIGAGVKISELGASPLVRRWLPVLHSAVPHFASPSLRNMATIGGNAATASPCADGVCALCAEGASVWLELKGKKRRLALPDLFRGPKRTSLRKGELITAFEVPRRDHAGAYLKLGPRAYFGISKVSVAAALELDGDKIRSASIALASVAPVPLMAFKTANYLAGRILNEENARTAAALVKTEVSPITDGRSDAAYRREMSGVLLESALKLIAGRR
ncbi:MAG: xanthine dehydrogenase family protein subunit M [Elusimicrobiales bacterium]|jgi:CO/xanthine dehydrogenase FAD-binding subunit